MNNASLYQRLRETGWRRDLSGAETAELRAWLAAHPEARPDWELEEQVTRSLRGLRAVPVASNFTARVLQTVETQRDVPARAAGRRWWRPLVWAPRFAWLAVALAAGLFTYHQHEAAQRHALGEKIAAVSNVKTVPSPEILQDFDAIRRLGQAPPADVALLKVLE